MTATLLLVPSLVTALGFQQIRFEGNRGIPSRTLQSVLLVKSNALYTPDQLRRSASSVRELYLQRGFLDVVVDMAADTMGAQRTLTFRIQEGRRARVRRVDFTGLVGVSRDELLDIVDLRRSEFLDRPRLNNARQGIIEFYRNRGYHFVRCSLELVRIDSNGTSPRVDVRYGVTEGPACYISQLVVRGNKCVSPDLIRRYVGVGPGDRYSQERLIKAQRRLYASRLFDRVYLAIGPVAPETSIAAIMVRPIDSLIVRFDLVELAPRAVGLGAGLQLLPWRGLLSAEWEHLNVWGDGHTFRIGADYSPALGQGLLRDYRFGLDLCYRIPYLTRWQIDLATSPFAKWEYRFGTYQFEYGAESGAGHDFTTALSVQAYNRLRWVALRDTANPDGTIRATTNSLSVRLSYDTRNDPFYPRRGFFLRPNLELAGGPIGGSNDFYRLTLEARGFVQLPLGHVLALRCYGGVALPFGRSGAIPYYEQFYLGGVNSLRGYPERSLGPVVVVGDSTRGDSSHYGDVLLNNNIELRTPYLRIPSSVVKGIGLVIFSDGGTVFGNQKNYCLERYHYALGAGIRLDTPIGPIRFDYGRRMVGPRPGDWGQVYFAILNLF